jgi:hypothetical protein
MFFLKFILVAVHRECKLCEQATVRDALPNAASHPSSKIQATVT